MRVGSWTGNVAVILAAMAAPAGGQTAGQSGPPVIAVSGSAESHVASDRASVFVGVRTRGTSAAIAAQDNARRVRSIIDTLRAAGIEGDQLKTADYSVSPETRYDNTTQTTRVIGYT